MRHAPALVLFVILLSSSSATAAFPYPAPPAGVSATDFAQYAFIPEGAPLPNDYAGGDVWKYSSEQSGDPFVDSDPRELFGVTGMSVDLAWRRSTGRPDVVVAVIDSGIDWNAGDLRHKAFLNAGELPVPFGAGAHDADGSGTFDVRDYAGDPRVADANGNGVIDAQDLIRLFSDGVDDDANGYVDDISGWDVLDDTNDPWDEVRYGHGTGEARDSAGEADNGGGMPGTCPNCMFLPIRVGLSFVAHDNDFGEAVVFAVDAGAHVIQEALGTIDNTPFSQEAIAYAWRRGVAVIASAADEEAYHHNYPSGHEHTIVLNSVTRFDFNVEHPKSYLYLNGCTNWGGNIALTVPSTSCSSEATGRGAGVAGLIVSHALNQRDRGLITNYPMDDGSEAPFVLSANEMRQLLTASADDIDLSTAPGVVATLPTKRFPTTPGWEPTFGAGRMNADRALALVDAGTVPPEAEIVSPKWWSIVDPARSPTVEITGLAAAQRSAHYDYVLEYGCGLTPLTFTTIAAASGRTRAVREGALGTLDAAAAHDACLFGAVVSPTAWDYHVTLRLRVTDAEGNVGEHRKVVYVFTDPSWHPGFPLDLGASGESSPRFFDVDGDGKPELVVPSNAGVVHAFLSDGSQLPGWPARTRPLDVHAASAAFASGEITIPVRDAVSFGGVGIADVDNDGSTEVFAVTQEGRVYCWREDASLCGLQWPVRSHRPYSSREIRDEFNTLLPGFNSAPVLVDLDGDGDLEVVAAAMDRHVYAWHHDATPVAGFPVHLADTTKVDVDPVTRKVTPKPGSGTLRGSQILGTPTVADLDGDGSPELVVGTNEEYREEPNVGLSSASIAALGPADLLATGNGRLFAVHADGSPVAGWPVKVALLATELLPYVGEGVVGSAAAADVDGDGDDEVAIFGTAGPAHLFDGDGSSYYGVDPMSGNDLAMATDAPRASAAVDTPTFPALGMGGFARILPGGPLTYYAPSIGLGRALDAFLVGDQIVSEDHVTAWDARTGVMVPGYPAVVEDLQFLTNPVAVDVDGDGIVEIVTGTGGYMLHAFKPGGVRAPGFPKFTGHWIIDSPATGDFDGDGYLEMAVDTREGWLFVYDLAAPADARREWWSFHHDERNTGNYATPDPLAEETPPLVPQPPVGVPFTAALAFVAVMWRRRLALK